MQTSETQRRLRELAQSATALAAALERRESHGPDITAIGRHETAVRRDLRLVAEALRGEDGTL